MSKYGLSALLFAGCVSLVFAEEAKPVKEGAAPKSAVSSDEHKEMADPNRSLASCIAVGNQEEIALTRFAIEHIKDPEVKKFAQMLIDDHTRFGTQLAPFASEVASKPFDGATTDERTKRQTRIDERNKSNAAKEEAKTARREARRNDGKDVPERITVTAAHSGHWAQDQMTHLERQVATECLSLGQMELTEAKEAGEIDQAFLGCQIAAHLGMIAKLTVFEGEAKGELAQVFGEGRAATQKHLDEAKRLMHTLKEKK